MTRRADQPEPPLLLVEPGALDAPSRCPLLGCRRRPVVLQLGLRCGAGRQHGVRCRPAFDPGKELPQHIEEEQIHSSYQTSLSSTPLLSAALSASSHESTSDTLPIPPPTFSRMLSRSRVGTALVIVSLTAETTFGIRNLLFCSWCGAAYRTSDSAPPMRQAKSELTDGQAVAAVVHRACNVVVPVAAAACQAFQVPVYTMSTGVRKGHEERSLSTHSDSILFS
eukprot:753458-Hanusia_phi.AAC.1